MILWRWIEPSGLSAACHAGPPGGDGRSGGRPRARLTSATAIPARTKVAATAGSNGGRSSITGVRAASTSSPIGRSRETRANVAYSKMARPARNSAGPPRRPGVAPALLPERAAVGLVGESFQGSDRHNRRLDDELVRDPGDEEEAPDAELWDAPGHDGIVTDPDRDPDRVDLRSEIGKYVSLVTFPAEVRALIAMAEQGCLRRRVGSIKKARTWHSVHAYDRAVGRARPRLRPPFLTLAADARSLTGQPLARTRPPALSR
jgi:hypothetical protein